jgi:hypothetical protein
MSIIRNPPNRIHLGGPVVQENRFAASEAITPGMLVEMFTNAGITRLKKSTRTGLASSQFAIDHSMANKGCDDAYATNDLVETVIASPGAQIWGLIPSGQTITAGQMLSDNGDGTLKAVSGVAIAQALESVTATALTRIRVSVV